MSSKEETETSPLLYPQLPHGETDTLTTRSISEASGNTGQQNENDIMEEPDTFMEQVTIEFMEHAQEVADTVMEDLHDADHSELHFLEMGLTRNLSVLPGDIVDVATNPTNEESQQLLPIITDGKVLDTHDLPSLDTSSSTPFSAYILLFIAIISLSSIGPLVKLQDDASPSMKVVWRMMGTTLLLFPFASWDVYKNGLPPMNPPQWMTFLLATICYDIMTLSFILSLNYTAVGNAVILANSLSLILLIGKLFVGAPISRLEGCGALVAFGGAVLCSKDSAESHEGSNGLYGDALAVLSAVGGVGYLIFAKTTRQHMSMYPFMFLTMLVGGSLVACFQALILREPVTLDRHINHGVWGFMVSSRLDRLPLEAVVVLVCNFFGTMGYVRAMQHFDNLVISSAALMEPVVAAFIACLLGVGSLPGIQGWIGNFLVGLGTFAVIYEDGRRKKESTHHKSSSLH